MLKLEVITPRKKALETEVDSVTLPGSDGELGILPEHIPMITTLDTGIVSYKTGSQKQLLVVHWGYAQVEGARVTVLAELAESVAEIDLDRAKNAEVRARDILSKIDLSASDWELEKKRSDKYEFKLKRALIRQKAASLM
jgi:F-type H+-transporting ATPase subunit epsilon